MYHITREFRAVETCRSCIEIEEHGPQSNDSYAFCVESINLTRCISLCLVFTTPSNINNNLKKQFVTVFGSGNNIQLTCQNSINFPLVFHCKVYSRDFCLVLFDFNHQLDSDGGLNIAYEYKKLFPLGLFGHFHPAVIDRFGIVIWLF